MKRFGGLRDTMEIAATVAVVLSLIYVGIQVKQNTLAIQTATSQGAYEYHRESIQEIITNRELAELKVRAESADPMLDAADSLRMMYDMNLDVNLYEFIYTSARLGTMEPEMAGGWLRGLPAMVCNPRFPAFWSQWGEEYHREFVQAIDSVQALGCT